MELTLLYELLKIYIQIKSKQNYQIKGKKMDKLDIFLHRVKLPESEIHYI